MRRVTCDVNVRSPPRSGAGAAPLKDTRASPDGTADSSDFHCHECGRVGEVLCCDTCDRVYHLGCIGSVAIDADHMPNPWSCHLCTSGVHPGPGGIWASKAGTKSYGLLAGAGTCDSHIVRSFEGQLQHLHTSSRVVYTSTSAVALTTRLG